MVTFWGIRLLSLGLGAMMFANHIWQLYLFFGVGRMVAIGVLSLSVSVSIANWFVRLRGRAMGITKIGDRLGSALLPLMVQFLILALGWRMAWGALGAVVFLMSGIPALVFLRHRPEDMGLSPDGALGTALIFLLAALHGLFLGGRNPMIPVIWANFFGRRSLGSIYSLGNPFYFTANAIGPVFAGLFFDLFGSYAFPFYEILPQNTPPCGRGNSLIQAGGKRTEAAFIQSQGAEDLLHLRLDAVALDELPRLLPDLPIRSGRWYRPE